MKISLLMENPGVIGCGHVVVVCLPTGHAFSKSVRRAIRRLHNRRNKPQAVAA